MTEEAVYQIAEQEGALIEEFPLKSREALSVLTKDGMFIAINPETVISKGDWLVKAMHEIGHCATGSFYTCRFPLETRRRLEERADRWAIKKLVPEDGLKEAVKKGISTPWDLADYFGVTEAFIKKAVAYYECSSLYAV